MIDFLDVFGTALRQIFSPIPFLQSVLGSIVAAFLGYRLGRRRNRVGIQVYKVEGGERARTRPRVVIAGFSGYQPDEASALSEEEFRAALAAADLVKLPLSSATRGIGTVVKVIETYADTLEDVFLVTTKSSNGTSSRDSVMLLRKYVAGTYNRPIAIHADEADEVDLEEDVAVTRKSHEVVEAIIDRLHSEKRYVPGARGVLVDVTGGIRAMSIGMLLACLNPRQDAHLIGTSYGRNGRADYTKSFPMRIHFEPRLEKDGA